MMNSLLIGLALSVGAPAPKETAKDPPKLEGGWVIESVEGPKDQPLQNVTFHFTEGKVSIIDAKRAKPEDASITVDLKKKPATIDIKPERGAKEEVVKGIFEINGDTLRLCFARDGKDRPTEFKGDAANGIMMITLKRVKSEK